MQLSDDKTVLIEVNNNDIKPDGSFDILKGVTSIGRHAFFGCRSLQKLIIPKEVTSIEVGTFHRCFTLQTMTIHEGINSIGDRAFAECSGLQTLTLLKGVTSIGCQAFYGCSSLQTLTLPEGVTFIGDEAFAGCSSLQTLIIPKGVTSIEVGTFQRCISLQTLTIPEGVNFIGDRAFYKCSSLQTLTLPEGITFIGDEAFTGCGSLKTIIIASEDDEEIKRITALLPKEMQNKATPIAFVEKASKLIKCQLANMAQIPETNLMYRFFNLNSRFSPKVQVKNEHGKRVRVECKKLPDEIFQHINRFIMNSNHFAVKTEKYMQSVPLPKNEHEMIAYQEAVEKIAHDTIKEAKNLHTPDKQVKTSICSVM